LNQKLDEKSLKLSLKASDTILGVYADLNQLIQILINLISNAWKYPPENGEITILASQRENRIFMVVRDAGIGMANNPGDGNSFWFPLPTIRTLKTRTEEFGLGTGGKLSNGLGEQHHLQVVIFDNHH
jgi:signal transduction histidine kinase